MASSASGQMGPPAPRAMTSKKRVLEEDTYTQVVESIIERDFFPSIPKLQNKLEWLQALESGDPNAICRAQINIARRRAGLKTPLPGETPMPGTGGRFTSTPGTALRTPAMTPLARPATGAATPSAATDGTASGATGAAAALSAAAATGARAPKMSLDQFFANYTGEDNASFEELLEAHNARKRAKVAHHLEGKNSPLLLEGPSPMDEFGSSGQTPSSLVLWKFEPKNKLYYDSSQQPRLEYSDKERAAMVAGPPKGIRHDATRLAPEVEEAQQLQLAAAGLADADAAAAGLGQPSMASLAGSGADPADALAAGAAAVPPPQHGAVGARAYLRTPSLALGVAASPLVTWGEIAATPLRLVENPDEDLSALGIDPAGGEGPQFKLPHVRRREAAAKEAFDRKKAVAMKRKPGGGPAGGSFTPLLDSMKRGTPGTPLSSAAQKLATKLGKMRGGAGGGGGAGVSGGRRPPSGAGAKGSSTGLLADAVLQQRLRASYTGTPSARPGGSGSGVTPQLPVRGVTPGGRTPQLRGIGGAAGARGGQQRQAGAGGVAVNGTGSITDDLLKLPK